jgi:hypothetical protein
MLGRRVLSVLWRLVFLHMAHLLQFWFAEIGCKNIRDAYKTKVSSLLWVLFCLVPSFQITSEWHSFYTVNGVALISVELVWRNYGHCEMKTLPSLYRRLKSARQWSFVTQTSFFLNWRIMNSSVFCRRWLHLMVYASTIWLRKLLKRFSHYRKKLYNCVRITKIWILK